MDDLKQILKMYFEGYSQRQISDRLKRSRNTVAEIDELPQGKPQTSTGRLTAAHATRLGYLNSRFAVMTTTSSNTTVCTHLVYLVASHILESHFHS